MGKDIADRAESIDYLLLNYKLEFFFLCATFFIVLFLKCAAIKHLFNAVSVW